MELIEILKALAHENRLRILNLLRKQPLCVCEIKTLMGIGQSNASRHLKKLKAAGLIRGERDGQWIHYRLNRENIEKHLFIAQLLEQEFDGKEVFVRDAGRLKEYLESSYTCENIEDVDLFSFRDD